MACVGSTAAGVRSLSLVLPFSPTVQRFSAAFPSSFTKRPRGSVARGGPLDWDDIAMVAEEKRDSDNPSDLRIYIDRVRACNRGSETRSAFVPFIVEEQVIGYVHNGFIDHLQKFQDVFTCFLGKDELPQQKYISLNESLKIPEERTLAIQDIIRSSQDMIPGIRNKLYPVMSSFGGRTLFCMERAASSYFGIKAFGVHMNGYVEAEEKFLWIGKRSSRKPTYPGMLDHLAAGGLPHGINCKENLIKECEEEAGIPRSISESAISVGAVSYMDIDGVRFKRDVLFCYDLKLPAGFVPENKDGEVDSFRLFPISHVANIIRRTDFFKPNCCLVIIDFLIRHGYITPDDSGYLELLQSLRLGDSP